ADKQWIMRNDPAVQLWDGETNNLWDSVTLIRCGGHFEGGTVLHWAGGAAGRGVVCAGGILTVATERKWLSFMRSYPNFIPLSARTVAHIGAALAPFAFETILAIISTASSTRTRRPCWKNPSRATSLRWRASAAMNKQYVCSRRDPQPQYGSEQQDRIRYGFDRWRRPPGRALVGRSGRPGCRSRTRSRGRQACCRSDCGDRARLGNFSAGRPVVACRSAPPRRRGSPALRSARSPDQQCRHRLGWPDRQARDQPGRLRIALRGQLSRRLSADPGAFAADRSQQACAHRQCLVARPAAD